VCTFAVAFGRTNLSDINENNNDTCAVSVCGFHKTDRQKCVLSTGSLQGLGQKVAMDSMDVLNEKIVIWV
jgi:hypothetical protein